MKNPLILAAGQNKPSKVVGRQYLKDVIRDGVWQNNKMTFEVDAAKREQMVQQFNLMRADGVPVEVVLDHKESATTTVGRVENLVNDGDTLYAQLSLTEEGEKAALGCQQVSLQHHKSFTAGNGKTYKDAITHVSIGPKCAVTGQNQFVQLSLEGGATQDIPVLTERPNYEAQVTQLQAENASLKAQVVQLGKTEDAPATPPTSLVAMAASNLDAQLSLLVDKGHISPACREKLQLALLGTPEDRGVITLALSHEPDLGKLVATQVILALQENKPIPMTEETGKQTVELQLQQEKAEPTGEEVTKELLGHLPKHLKNANK